MRARCARSKRRRALRCSMVTCACLLRWGFACAGARSHGGAALPGGRLASGGGETCSPRVGRSACLTRGAGGDPSGDAEISVDTVVRRPLRRDCWRETLYLLVSADHRGLRLHDRDHRAGSPRGRAPEHGAPLAVLLATCSGVVERTVPAACPTPRRHLYARIWGTRRRTPTVRRIWTGCGCSSRSRPASPSSAGVRPAGGACSRALRSRGDQQISDSSTPLRARHRGRARRVAVAVGAGAGEPGRVAARAPAARGAGAARGDAGRDSGRSGRRLGLELQRVVNSFFKRPGPPLPVPRPRCPPAAARHSGTQPSKSPRAKARGKPTARPGARDRAGILHDRGLDAALTALVSDAPVADEGRRVRRPRPRPRPTSWWPRR